MYKESSIIGDNGHPRRKSWWWTTSLALVASVLLLVVVSSPASSRSSVRSLSISSSSSTSSSTTMDQGKDEDSFDELYFHSGKRYMRRKKMLLGIFTMVDRDKEKERRQLIRDTYLKGDPFFSKEDQNDVVCHLQRYQEHFDRGEWEVADRCRIVYTFVTGRTDPSIPPDHFRTDRPLTVERPKNPEKMIMLNVRENLAEGKTYAYFKWAASLAPRYNLDYLVKVDDDTLVSLPHLLSKYLDALPPYPHNRRYYGGHVTDAQQCNIGVWSHCQHIVPHGYMAGQFYFLSPDLAHAVTNDDVERVHPNTGIEDLDMGRAVFRWSRTHKEMINMFTFGGKVHIWRHPVKEVDKWNLIWNNYKDKHMQIAF